MSNTRLPGIEGDFAVDKKKSLFSRAYSNVDLGQRVVQEISVGKKKPPPKTYKYCVKKGKVMLWSNPKPGPGLADKQEFTAYFNALVLRIKARSDSLHLATPDCDRRDASGPLHF